MKKIEIDIEGRVFTAVLNEEKAPRTCAAVLSILPVSGEVWQGRWSGDCIYLILKPAITKEILLTEGTMSRIYGRKGDVVFFDGRNPEAVPGHNDFQEFFFVYGDVAQYRFPWGDEVCNLFARIKEDQLEEFEAIGEDVWKNGRKKVTVRLKE